MRLALLALALCAVSPASAAYIEGELGLGCSDLEYQRRIDRAAGAGDKQAASALVGRALAGGQCVALKDGARVRIERNSYPYACVTPFGSADECLWVLQRYVNPRQ